MTDPAPPEGGDLFTRGGLNMPDTRGKSMVAVHLDKLQKEKEERGMEKLRLLMPQLSAATHAVALQECNWEQDKAVAMLRLFVAKKAVELKNLAREKKKHHKKLMERMNKAGERSESGRSSGSDSSRSDSDSDRGSDSDSGSSGSDEDGRRDRKRKDSSGRKRSRSSKSRKEDRHSKRKRSRKEKESKKGRSSGSRRKKRKDKQDKKEKKSRKDDRDRNGDAGRGVKGSYEYGAFGVIRETDYYTKRSEFMLWALEIKNADVESMSRYEEKELFKSYMEDYNTATLPHKKFYNLEAWEKEAAATGGGGGGASEKLIFDDEAERKKELLAERQREHAERLRAAYQELKTTNKAQDMREQELLRAKMALAYRTGDQKEAARLAERLKPDEPK